ncbi:hypothetical protein E4U53_006545 [Claviceps sorghi]|nr:hypothetical protein E4U53_006545 [Claviceps sorghi]
MTSKVPPASRCGYTCKWAHGALYADSFRDCGDTRLSSLPHFAIITNEFPVAAGYFFHGRKNFDNSNRKDLPDSRCTKLS